MDVRRSLKRKTDKGSALIKSPGAIIRSVTKLNNEIRERLAVSGAAQTPTAVEKITSDVVVPSSSDDNLPKVPSINTPVTSNDMVIVPDVDREEEMEIGIKDSTVTSESDSDLMDPTDIEEDSVNISAYSTVSDKSISNVTGDDGKLDLEKIRGWKLPKIKDINRSLSASTVSERTRSQQLRNTLPSTSIETTQPQAQSTPHPRMNRSDMLERVRSNLRSSGRFKAKSKPK